MNAVTDTNVTLREAAPDDARGIITVHRSAVLGVAKERYGEAIAWSWAAPETEAHEAILRAAIASDDERMLVAMRVGAIVSFGSIIVSTSSLRALYVHADHIGQGVGSALLSALEAEAKRRGLTRLSMNASLNAEGFYTRRGYRTLSQGLQTLRDGTEMPCLAMAKALA